MNKKNLLPALAACLLAAPALTAQTAQDTLNYYKKQAAVKSETRRTDRAFAAALAQNVGAWLRVNPQDQAAKDALLLQYNLQKRADEYPAALVSLLKIRFYYPSQADINLLNTNVDAVMNETDKKQKGNALAALAADTADLDRAEKEAALLEALVNIKSGKLYAVSAAEFEDFFVRNPKYAQNDKLELLYGDLHRQNGNYLAAVSQYKKVAELYAKTPYKAASLRMVGDVYADNLRDTETATAIYTSVLRQFPDSNEVGIVYKHMAIMDENNKNYESAVINYDKAAELLAGQEPAYEALRGKADVYLKTKDYQSAFDTLQAAAEAFRADEPKYADSMRKAAEVAQKRLKDGNLQTVTLEKILLAYPKTQHAPEIMYDLAYAYEKQGKAADAIGVYKKLIVSYPTDSYANKAQGRLSRLEK